jgi:uncharacterized membrane protein
MGSYSGLNLLLYIASYTDDPSAAKSDYESLKGLDDVAVVASVLMSRDADGKVDVDELGGVAGLVVGLFAPPLLAATAIGAGVGAAAGAIAKHHQEHTIASSVEAEDWLPRGSSAIVAVIDDQYLDRIDAAVGKAQRKLKKAIDKGDYDAVVKALNEGGEKVVEAVES